MKFSRLLAGGALAAAFTCASVQAQEITLRVAHFLPPIAIAQTKIIAPWCERIQEQSKGQLKCQIYPAMSLGGTPPQLISQARDGVADIVWTLPGYTPGRFPISEVFELPFMMTTHEASSRAIWDYVQKNAMKEFEGLQPIAVWVNGPNLLHFRNKKVETLEDLKGMKIRAPSRLGNRLLAALGATPVGMPVPQLAESLSRGVIDGALVPWEILPATKTHEMVRYHAGAGAERAMTTATFVYVMNKKRYDSLPPHLKKVIDDNSGRETSAWVAQMFRESDADGIKAAQARGNEIYEISQAEIKRWEEATRPVAQEWIRETTAAGHNGQALYDEARALIKKYSEAK